MTAASGGASTRSSRRPSSRSGIATRTLQVMAWLLETTARRPGAGTDDAVQARMERQIEVERLRRAFDVTLRSIGSSFPRTEAAAKAARAALHLPESAPHA